MMAAKSNINTFPSPTSRCIYVTLLMNDSAALPLGLSGAPCLPLASFRRVIHKHTERTVCAPSWPTDDKQGKKNLWAISLNVGHWVHPGRHRRLKHTKEAKKNAAKTPTFTRPHTATQRLTSFLCVCVEAALVLNRVPSFRGHLLTFQRRRRCINHVRIRSFVLSWGGVVVLVVVERGGRGAVKKKKKRCAEPNRAPPANKHHLIRGGQSLLLITMRLSGATWRPSSNTCAGGEMGFFRWGWDAHIIYKDLILNPGWSAVNGCSVKQYQRYKICHGGRAAVCIPLWHWLIHWLTWTGFHMNW